MRVNPTAERTTARRSIFGANVHECAISPIATKSCQTRRLSVRPCTESRAAACPSLSDLRRPASLRRRDGKLNIDCNNPVRVSIGEPAEKCAEELPLATGLARADDFTINDAVDDGPIHPAWVQHVFVLNPAAAPSCRESAQLACAHRIDECFVQICSSAFDNLKANHPSPPPIKLSRNGSRFR